MGNLNSLEILRESMEVVHSTVKFYRQGGKLITSNPLKAIFSRFAEDELNHLEKLEFVYDSLAENDEWLVDKDLLETAPSKLKKVGAIGEDRDLSECLTESDIVEHGIKLESDSIKLFKEAHKDCSKGDRRGCIVFKWLIKTKADHLTTLKEVHERLTKSD
jgi:rubrerythrin